MLVCNVFFHCCGLLSEAMGGLEIQGHSPVLPARNTLCTLITCTKENLYTFHHATALQPLHECQRVHLPSSSSFAPEAHKFPQCRHSHLWRLDDIGRLCADSVPPASSSGRKMSYSEAVTCIADAAVVGVVTCIGTVKPSAALVSRKLHPTRTLPLQNPPPPVRCSPRT